MIVNRMVGSVFLMAIGWSSEGADVECARISLAGAFTRFSMMKVVGRANSRHWTRCLEVYPQCRFYFLVWELKAQLSFWMVRRLQGQSHSLCIFAQFFQRYRERRGFFRQPSRAS